MKKVVWLRKTKTIVLLLAVMIFSLSAVYVADGAIKNSVHDLTSGSPTPTIDPCMFCHTPHHARADLKYVPIWNVTQLNSVTYTMYSAPIGGTPSGPSGVSLACLSCHDGSGVVGDLQHQIQMYSNPGYMDPLGGNQSLDCNRCHYPGANDYSIILGHDGGGAIGSDLTNDHPISITYPDAGHSDYNRPGVNDQKGWVDVKLFDGKVECSSCHDPHGIDCGPRETRVVEGQLQACSNPLAPFLRKSNAGSALCLTCHIK